jgi:hypothetical protein
MLGAGSTYGRARLPFASGSANNVSAKDYLRARQTNTAENLGHSSSQGHIFEFDWLCSSIQQGWLSAMASLDCESLLCKLYYHVVLPRDLPSGEDHNLPDLQHELLRRLVGAVRQLATYAPLEDTPQIEAIGLALTTCRSLHSGGRINGEKLVEEMREFFPGKALILHVTEQNAALLIYQDKKYVECFAEAPVDTDRSLQ